MTKEGLAALLTGREIGYEITRSEEAEAKAAYLVVVFGASDDLIELRGAIDDECGAGESTEIKIDCDGLVPDFDNVDHDDKDEMRSYFKREGGPTKAITVLWCAEEGYSWTYQTTIPHSTFEIVEDGEHYCRGIVFSLADLPGITP